MCGLHTEIPLSSPEEHDVGAQSKTQTSYKFRQHVYASQHVIKILRLELQVLDAGVKKMKQDTEVTTKELEILQTEISAI